MHFRQVSPDVARGAFAACSLVYVAVLAVMRLRLGAAGDWAMVARLCVVALAVGGSFVWWFINGQVEGSVLMTLAQGHGITQADVLVIPHLAAALYVLTIR